SVPGPVHTMSVSPRPDDLVKTYIQHVGGDPGAYRGRLPAHLFPQWGFPLTGKLMEGLSYPMLAAMNGGCKLTINKQLPAGDPLEVTGQLVSVDDNGQRAILDQVLTTGTRSKPEAVVAHLYVFVPLGGAKKNGKANGKSDKPRVPVEARELAFWKLRADAG